VVDIPPCESRGRPPKSLEPIKVSLRLSGMAGRTAEAGPRPVDNHAGGSAASAEHVG